MLKTDADAGTHADRDRPRRVAGVGDPGVAAKARVEVTGQTQRVLGSPGGRGHRVCDVGAGRGRAPGWGAVADAALP